MGTPVVKVPDEFFDQLFNAVDRALRDEAANKTPYSGPWPERIRQAFDRVLEQVDFPAGVVRHGDSKLRDEVTEEQLLGFRMGLSFGNYIALKGIKLGELMTSNDYQA